MNQVTCSLCNIKIDEIKRKEHLVSTNHLKHCSNVPDNICNKVFQNVFLTHVLKMIFNCLKN